MIKPDVWVSFGVQELDQVNEGLEVWCFIEDELDSEELANKVAREERAGSVMGRTRVVRITYESMSMFAEDDS